MGTPAFSAGVKRPGREADHSLPTSAKVKKMWIYLYIHSPIRLHGAVLNSLNTGTTLPFYKHHISFIAFLQISSPSSKKQKCYFPQIVNMFI
jgi:hypothetical protein